jgi:5,10-methylenetetrahydromethanopterin reductase
VTDDEQRVRGLIQKNLAMYGELPSYKAMFEREGVAGPGELAIIGSAGKVADAIGAMAEAGVTDFAASEFTTNAEERRQTRALLQEWV